MFEGSIIRIARRLDGAFRVRDCFVLCAAILIGVFVCVFTECFPVLKGSMFPVRLFCTELLRQLRAAATSVGNAELLAKFEEGAKLLKHGIIFAGSLYL